MTLSAMETLQDIQAAILHNKVPGEEPAELVTDSLSVLLSRQENWQLDGLALESKDGGFRFQLPSGMHEFIDKGEEGQEDDIIDTQVNLYISSLWIFFVWWCNVLMFLSKINSYLRRIYYLGNGSSCLHGFVNEFTTYCTNYQEFVV